MSPGNPDLKTIFISALERPEGPERDAYLADSCGGDPAFLRRVEDLLAAFERAGVVPGPAGTSATAIGAGSARAADAPTGALARDRRADLEVNAAQGQAADVEQTADNPRSTVPGDPEATAAHDRHGDGSSDGGTLPPGMAVRYFGDYEIRRELGRGGMGVVYEARQRSLNRPVALKMLKAGLLAGEDELRRFRNEAEAVALLDHRGVVPVYEVGEHAGQHFFSMKLVDGGSLVPLMDRYRHDPRAVAGLVAGASEAVAHAHARGILHRDLKPANILVDAQGHPHITDFGLAKRVEADVELTQSGAVLGTPAYMSPEQASGRRGAVTTASDVYGLGAVLYALLTGRAPFGGSSVVETLEAVRNTPPVPPGRHNAGVPRDLETICLKCLEKDPRRRYPTAQGLADDLRAWLENRPIAARRVGPAERAWLWCRRRPAIAALSAAVALALIGGTATVIAVQARANDGLRAANRRVEQRYELAVDAIKSLHTGVSEDFLLEQDQFKEVRDRLLKSAASFYVKFGALLGRESDVASRRALAASNFELADLTGKVGRKEQAMATHQSVLAAREALAAEPGAGAVAKADVERSLTAIALLLAATGKRDEALAVCRRSEALLAGPAGSDPSVRAALAACRTRIGHLLSATGRTDEALEAYERARADQEAPAAAPGASNDARRALADTVTRIANLLAATGKPAEAEARYRKATAILRDLADDNRTVTEFRSELANSRHNLGLLLSSTGRTAEAEAEYRASMAIRREIAEDNPGVSEFRMDLANSRHMLATRLSQSGKPKEAEAEYREAIAIQRRLADDNPTVTMFRSHLAVSHSNVAVLLYQTGKPTEAEAEFRASMAVNQKLADDNPDATEFRSQLAYSHYGLGWLLGQTGKPSEAAAEYRKALVVQRKLADDNPEVAEFRNGLATSHNSLGLMLLDMGKPQEAEAEYRAGLAIQRKLADLHPTVSDFRRNLAYSRNNLGILLRQTGKLLQAEAEHGQALTTWRKLVDDNPGVTEFRSQIAFSHICLGVVLFQANRLTEAEAMYRPALAIYQKLAAADPKVPAYRDGEADTANNLSVALRQLGRPAEAQALCEGAVAIREALIREDPETTGFRSGLAENCLNRGLARRATGDVAGAAADLRRAAGLYDALASRTGEQSFRYASVRAALSDLASATGSGVSATEAASEADAAIALLHKAVELGYLAAQAYRTEHALDPLRQRTDFRLLMMDLAMPAEPFVPAE